MRQGSYIMSAKSYWCQFCNNDHEKYSYLLYWISFSVLNYQWTRYGSL